MKTKEEMFNAFLEEYFFAYVIWAKLYKKDVFHIDSFIELKYTEDTYMCLKAFDTAHSVSVLSYEGYHYVAQPLSTMANSKLIDTVKDRIVTYNMVNDICKNLSSQLQYKANRNLS